MLTKSLVRKPKRKQNYAYSRSAPPFLMKINLPESPPSINSNPIQKIRTRYITQTGFSSAIITCPDLFQTRWMAATTTTGFCLYNSFILKKVCIWGIPGSGVNFTWVVPPSTSTAIGNLSRTYNDVSTGVTYVPRIGVRPDPKSAAGMPQSAVPSGSYSGLSLGATFEFECPPGSYIEVTLYAFLNNNLPPIPAVAPSAGWDTLIPGKIYSASLDNSSSNSVSPVSWPSPPFP
jgi:hypothetical protein